MTQSPLLLKLGIVHGYANRHTKLHTEIAISQQVHGTRIAFVTKKDQGKTIPGVDGLVSKDISIGVSFADCVPILAVDPKAKIIGTAHAGWKGTLGGIAGELITAMKKNGADVKQIYISVGPHIGMCCYNVPDERARFFQKKFGTDEKIAVRIGDVWHIDIGYVNYLQLLEAGIVKENIDTPPSCTSCQVAEFHSFRKDPKEKFGVQMGVITL